MHTNPVAYFPFEAAVESAASEWNTRSTEEAVRSTAELRIKGVNFCELRKKEKKAVKPNWDAWMRVKVDTGRYKSPTEDKKQPPAISRPRVR